MIFAMVCGDNTDYVFDWTTVVLYIGCESKWLAKQNVLIPQYK